MNPWYIKERILWTRLYTFAPREFVFQREDTLIVENISLLSNKSWLIGL